VVPFVRRVIDSRKMESLNELDSFATGTKRTIHSIMDADSVAAPLSERLHVKKPYTMILRELIDEKPLNWKAIPEKLQRLRQSMEHWVSARTDQHQWIIS
jgi:hypothetical protein